MNYKLIAVTLALVFLVQVAFTSAQEHEGYPEITRSNAGGLSEVDFLNPTLEGAGSFESSGLVMLDDSTILAVYSGSNSNNVPFLFVLRWTTPRSQDVAMKTLPGEYLVYTPATDMFAISVGCLFPITRSDFDVFVSDDVRFEFNAIGTPLSSANANSCYLGGELGVAGSFVVSGSFEKVLDVFDLAQKDSEHILHLDMPDNQRSIHVALSPDTTRVAASANNESVYIWSIPSASLMTTIPAPHSTDIKDIAFSPDNQLIAVSYHDVVIIWDVESGSKMVTIPSSNSHSTAFSPDGTVITTIDDTNLKVWDVARGEQLATLEGHLSDVVAVVFSPNGKLIVSLDEEKVNKVWAVTASGIDDDEDGVDDALDRCLGEAGPANGCPDGDEDGVADIDDACPDETGTISALGCPDGDDDGVADEADVCPDVAGSSTAQGCPDDDEDGLPNNEDACPNDAGEVALQGCADSDEDGIIDSEDACPTLAGVANLGGCLYIGSVQGNVNLREGPGTTYAVVGSLKSGDEFSIIGRNAAADWLHVRIERDEGEPLDAWIFANLVTTDAELDTLPTTE